MSKNAIVPLNIAAIRVNENDSTNVVSGFQGNTAVFDEMPWYNTAAGAPPYEASLGSAIYKPLGETESGAPLNSPTNPLKTGVHLQWELPDYFKKGKQTEDGSSLEFPAVPNRWLVTRFLSIYDSNTETYGTIKTKSWIVESDYIASALSKDKYGLLRPMISVQLPKPSASSEPPYSTSVAYQQQPYMYMGRVVDYEDWDPANESSSDYLPAYEDSDGEALYLTSIGFVGSYFGSYYPECCSVFGFWDHFSDIEYEDSTLYEALTSNTEVQFRVTYRVSGWLNESSEDPLNDIDELVTAQYDDYLAQCTANSSAPELTPTDFFQQITTDDMNWTFNLADVGYTLNTDNTIASLNFPERTLCSGTAQEVVWNMLEDTGTTYFLKSNDADNVSVWSSEVEVSVGNSTEEAVAAMLKYDMGQVTDDTDVLTNYEQMLDALQLGLLGELEDLPNKLITLEELLHSNGFSHYAGGYLWIISSQDTETDEATDPEEEVTLPLVLAEQLYLLNNAQKNYDMGRGALNTMRRQLFMDWSHYLNMYTANPADPYDPNITIANMTSFLYVLNGTCELQSVIDEGNTVGILSYTTDPLTGEVTGISEPASVVLSTSLAYSVYTNYLTVLDALEAYPQWTLKCTKAPDFYQPRDPVFLLQGDMIEPAARNGTADTTFIRLSPEILSELNFTYEENAFTVSVSELSGVPQISSDTPMQDDVQSMTGETYLITPMLASVITTALASQGGDTNPAVTAADDFTTSLMYMQGGLSPLDLSPNAGGVPASTISGLFGLVGGDTYTPAANPVIENTSPLIIQAGFTNASDNGWPPDIIGWTTQSTLSTFSADRVDPFLPVFMVWNVTMNPLQWESADSEGNPIYSETNLTDFFELDKDEIDYQYKMNGDTPVDFTSPESVTYDNSATMSSNSTGPLTYQISSYIANHPDDADNALLEKIAALYSSKNFLSQSIGGFNTQQVLTSFVAQINVQDLTKGPRDSVTNAIASAAVSNAYDNWYDYNFNSLLPISTGLLAQRNFGPLRSGFMEISSIEIVDAFGQRMDLYTANQEQGAPLSCITSAALTPLSNDTVNAGKIYLPPRVLMPTRLWFQWLSASYDPSVAGITSDFPEMSSHPATSPVCGWIMPNHLDNNLFFYDENGSAIGTFGIEHVGTNPEMVYRTRAGNTANPTNSLALDIGEPGSPTVNPSLANYMWYLDGQDAQYLQDLMSSILNSEAYINPANYAQDASLSVLIGRPLALTRVVLGLETSGNLLPLSQADNDPESPFPQDVNASPQRVTYEERMPNSSANLSNVNFPVRLGEISHLDDGLVGYIIEGTDTNPYTGATFYSPAATENMDSGVAKPTDTTIQITLNADPIYLTFLVDPRAGVHATTGILPVNEISIPSDQYSEAMDSLAVNFTARPLLKMAQEFIVPLPAESGYSWSWITPGATDTTSLATNAADATPIYGYTPQTLQEGWLQLTPNADSEETTS